MVNYTSTFLEYYIIYIFLNLYSNFIHTLNFMPVIALQSALLNKILTILVNNCLLGYNGSALHGQLKIIVEFKNIYIIYWRQPTVTTSCIACNSSFLNRARSAILHCITTLTWLCAPEFSRTGCVFCIELGGN